MDWVRKNLSEVKLDGTGLEELRQQVNNKVGGEFVKDITLRVSQ